MKMRLVLLVVGALLAAFVVTACGDDEDSGGGGGDTSAQTESGGGSAEETNTEESGGGGDASDPNVQQAVEACEQQIGAQPNISEDVKSDLQEICKKAASGDEQEVREATKEVCLKLIDETAPAGPAGEQIKEQAKAACEQATATP
jgi:hypothetical protein